MASPFARWLPFKRRRTDAGSQPHTTNDTIATVTTSTSTPALPASPAGPYHNPTTTPSAALVLGQPIIPNDEFNALSTSAPSPVAVRTRSATVPVLARKAEPPPPVYSRPPSPHLSPPPRPSPKPGAGFSDRGRSQGRARQDSPPTAPGVLPTPDEEYNTFGRAARISLSAVRPSSSMSAVRSGAATPPPTAVYRPSSSTPPSAFPTIARYSDPTNSRSRPALADARLSMTPSTSNSSHGSPLPRRSASLQEHERQRERARRRRRLRASATGSMGAISGAAVLAEGRVEGGAAVTRSNTSSSSASSPSIFGRSGHAHAAEPSVPFTFGFAHGRRERMRGGMGSRDGQHRQNSADSAMSASPLSAMQEQAPITSGGHEPATRPEPDTRDSHEASPTDSPGADPSLSSPTAHDPSDSRAAAAPDARPAHTRLLALFSSAAAASPSPPPSRDAASTAPAQISPSPSSGDSDSASPYQAILAALEPSTSSAAPPESPLRPPVLPRPPSPAHSTASRGSRASRFTEMLDDSRVSVVPASPGGVAPLRPSDAANRPPRVAKRRHSDLGAASLKPGAALVPRKTRVSILSGGGHDRPGFEFSVTPPTMERISAVAESEPAAGASASAPAPTSKSEGKRKASDPESVDSMGRIRSTATGKRPHTASGATAPSTSGHRSAKRVRLSAPGTPSVASQSARHRGESSGTTAAHHLSRTPSRSSATSKYTVRTSRSIPVRAIVSPRPPSIAGSAHAYHMRDPHLPPPPPVGWRPVSMVSENLDEEKALGKPEAASRANVKKNAPWTAWAFYLGFVLFPLWWIAALTPVRAWPARDRRDWEGWIQARDERVWRNRNRWMSVIGLLLYVPVIVLAAVFGMHATVTDSS